MKKFFVGFLGGIMLAFAGGIFVFNYLEGGISFDSKDSFSSFAEILPQRKKTSEELFQEAFERSKNIKGLYMTADVASDPGRGATGLRNYLIGLATSTEINGMVIDVKEVCGPDYNAERLRELVADLKNKNIWTIARIVVFKDHSQTDVHPEWYLTRESPKAVGNECWNKRHLKEKHPEGEKPSVIFWRDRRGGYWLDPAEEGAREYIAEFSKKMIDLGFDELQFDYIRFPSDGDVARAVYPAWDGKTPKYEVMKSFFEYLNKNLKSYKPDIILSADLFGYAAIRAGDVGIGQRLDDIGDSFDYISFMVYPSHYYSGFYMGEDRERGLPAVNLDRWEARAKPDIVIGRSLMFARDFLDGKLATSSVTVLPTNGIITATSTVEIAKEPKPRSQARLRPWLEDFFHEADQAAGRPYDAEKVRLQIDAAEDAEGHGWLLWNAANIYTEDALRKE